MACPSCPQIRNVPKFLVSPVAAPVPSAGTKNSENLIRLVSGVGTRIPLDGKLSASSEGKRPAPAGRIKRWCGRVSRPPGEVDYEVQ